MVSFSSADRAYMARALVLAQKGAIWTSPNPRVGAVIVQKGKIVAEGYHARCGAAHAEVMALNEARRSKIDLRGATLYVTLEPCSHLNKKTPPCVPHIVEAGISRVVIAMKDPNPAVLGRGIAMLKKAGIAVEVGCAEKEAQKLNEVFAFWKKKNRPFVSLKIAASLDGAIATKTGASRYITSQESRTFVHQLRDEHDAILVGRGTVCVDNPVLDGIERSPRRIILDSTLNIPLSAKVLRDTNVILITTHRAPKKKCAAYSARGITVKIFKGNIRIKPLLTYLSSLNISSLLVEGGSEVFASFLESRLVDRLYYFVAPKIIGGVDAKRAVGGKGSRHLSDAIELTERHITHIGQDILITAQLK